MSAPPHVAGAASHWAHLPMAEPARLEAALTLAGAPFRPLRRALHVDCGRGVTPAILSACGVEAHGLVLREDEAADARALAAASGARVHSGWREAEAALGPGALDLIAVPECWEELDEAAREALIALAARALAPGGALMLTHEVLPGAAEELPLRQLARLCWARTDPGASEAARAAQALARLEEALALSHALFRGYGGFDAQMAELRALPPELAARRWFRRPAAPEGVERLCARLERAGLRLAAPADPARLLRDLDFTPEQQALIAARIPQGGPAAEELGDILARRLRRADLFVKPGGRRADPAALRLAARGPAGAPPGRVEGLLGSAALSRRVHGPMLEALRADGPARLGALAERLGMTLEAARRAAAALLSSGDLAPAPEEPPAAPPRARAVNAALAARADGRGGPRALAAPAIGGAVELDAEGMRLAGAALGGADEDVDSLIAALGDAQPPGQGGAAASPAMAALRRRAERFVHQDFSILRALGAI
ncbi:hypothetical protein [Oceanicella actignis]|uniref:Cyclopropane fatty-acyl-phospholipid synthase n=1 Tax=Oceanicella actignis TaxID=1189325 RepID=A0A1M7TXZ1_9RHOB|nr:hypothetical protein [Oceanicella actignis]SET81214.1 Cyclopropane fatty-acyl-phospholipid synthase [Oceanicella actignis]SHN75606.1 Cyclopropane fatty-acyl-phospholipid synthase [Oceanicella actignis]